MTLTRYIFRLVLSHVFCLQPTHRSAHDQKTARCNRCRTLQIRGTSSVAGRNHRLRTIRKLPRREPLSQTRPGGALPLWPSAPRHQMSADTNPTSISGDFSSCNPRAAPRTWFGNPYLNRYGAHSKLIPQARMHYWVAKSSRASFWIG